MLNVNGPLHPIAKSTKGGVKKFLLNRLVDFSIKWVGGGGGWVTAGPLRKMMTCEKWVG